MPTPIFWRGAGVDRVRLAQVLPQQPDTADELNAVAKTLALPLPKFTVGGDASETTVKRYRIIRSCILLPTGSWRATSKVSRSRRWRGAFQDSQPNATTDC